MAKLSLSGTVLETTFRSGTARESGNPYSFTNARILCGKSDVIDVLFSDRYEHPVPGEGEVVDLVVNVKASVFRGNARVEFEAVKPSDVLPSQREHAPDLVGV